MNVMILSILAQTPVGLRDFYTALFVVFRFPRSFYARAQKNLLTVECS